MPDDINTYRFPLPERVFMAEFVWVWLKELRRHTLDPMARRFEQLDKLV